MSSQSPIVAPLAHGLAPQNAQQGAPQHQQQVYRPPPGPLFANRMNYDVVSTFPFCFHDPSYLVLQWKDMLTVCLL
jgi:hypothetical protein